MKLKILLLVLCASVYAYSSTTSGRTHTHADRKLQEEFDNIYYMFSHNNNYTVRTSAQLNLMVPAQIGEYYWNTDTNELYVATGTLVDQWIAR